MIQVGNAQIYTGDVLDVLSTLPSESVHVCVTSPPYYGLRDYGIEGQIGLEDTPDAWLERMVCVFREVRRVLRPDGTLWLNVGDSYATSQNGRSAADVKALGKDDRTFRDKPFSTVGNGYKPKDIMMMPARLALALQSDGWWLRSEIVWAKQSPMPESVTDRPTSAHEKIYLLSRAQRYYYDADAVREKAADSTLTRVRLEEGRNAEADSQSTGGDAYKRCETARVSVDRYSNGADHLVCAPPANGRNMRNVWNLASEPTSAAHFATFPTEIPRRAILAGTSEKGCCPACGAGWVRVVEERRGGTPLPHEGNSKNATFYLDNSNQLGPNVIRNRIELGWQPSCACIGQRLSEGCRDSNEMDALHDLQPATVLDPFSGYGTTCLVANRLNRRSIGIELNPQYVAMSVERLNAGRVLGGKIYKSDAQEVLAL